MNDQGLPEPQSGASDTSDTPSTPTTDFGAGLGSASGGSDSPAPAPSSEDAPPKPRRKRSGGRSRRASSDGDAGASEAQSAEDPAPGSDSEAKPRPARKRSRRTTKSEDDGREEAASEDGPEGEEPKRPRRKRTRRSAARTSEDEPASAEEGEGPSSEEDKPRRRRSRRSTGDEGGTEARDAESSADPEASEGEQGGDPEDGEPKKRRRRRRGGRRRRGRSAEGDEESQGDEDGAETDPGETSDADDQGAEGDREDGGDGDGDGEPRKRRRRRGGRGRGKRKGKSEGGDGDGDAEGKEADAGDAGKDAEGEGGSDKEKPARKKRKRSRRKKSGSGESELEEELSEEELAAKAEAERVLRILVNASEPEERRVAVVEEDDRIVDLLMTAESQKTLVNDIYRGKVVNLEPAIGAAFIDFGQGRNGFLHTSDVMPIYGEEGFKLDQLLTANLDPEDWSDDAHDDDDAIEDAGDEAPDGADADGDAGSDPDSAEGSDPEAAEGSDDEAAEGSDGGSAEGSDPESAEGADAESADKPARGRRSRSRKKASSKKAAVRKDSARREVRRRSRKKVPISDLLKVGDQVVVQVTKDAIGDKGPTLTTYISIPGRYLVLMPSMERTGVSKKIPDDKERRRLKRVLQGMKCPEGMGVIVRTAGVGRKKSDLQRDLDYLMGVWESFGKRLKHGRGPSALYQESDLAIRTLRDLFDERTAKVVVDDVMVHEQMLEFAEQLMPEQKHRIVMHDGDRPVFHHFGIEQEFERVFARKLDLPSGGSLVFDQAEALVAIDINSGRTRTDSHDFEKIALKTNLEAVPEIARQIRLRDLGGIVVIDFIDMSRGSSNRQVEKALRNEMAKDRARSKLGRIGQFGLLEMTRQRLGPGTHKKVFQACPRCRGTARVRTVESRAQAILRRLGSAVTQKGFSTVEVKAHPEVVDYLNDRLSDWIRAIEHRSERTINFTAVPDQVEDSVLRYLRADGREVRPGGRRKR